jgi:hypothetical protein
VLHASTLDTAAVLAATDGPGPWAVIAHGDDVFGIPRSKLGALARSLRTARSIAWRIDDHAPGLHSLAAHYVTRDGARGRVRFALGPPLHDDDVASYVTEGTPITDEVRRTLGRPIDAAPRERVETPARVSHYDAGRASAAREIRDDGWSVDLARSYLAALTPIRSASLRDANAEYDRGFTDAVRAFVASAPSKAERVSSHAPATSPSGDSVTATKAARRALRAPGECLAKFGRRPRHAADCPGCRPTT